MRASLQAAMCTDLTDDKDLKREGKIDEAGGKAKDKAPGDGVARVAAIAVRPGGQDVGCVCLWSRVRRTGRGLDRLARRFGR
jgi:hypothetical protein